MVADGDHHARDANQGNLRRRSTSDGFGGHDRSGLPGLGGGAGRVRRERTTRRTATAQRPKQGLNQGAPQDRARDHKKEGGATCSRIGSAPCACTGSKRRTSGLQEPQQEKEVAFEPLAPGPGEGAQDPERLRLPDHEEGGPRRGRSCVGMPFLQCRYTPTGGDFDFLKPESLMVVAGPKWQRGFV